MRWDEILNYVFGNKSKLNQEEATSVENKPAPETPQKMAPGTHIPYDEDLVAKLTEDHKVLIALYLDVAQKFQSNDFSSTAAALESFRAALQDHLLAENVRLYIYLEHIFSKDRKNYNIMHDFRYEMDGIGKAVVGFLNKYRPLAEQPELARTFAADLDQIGKVLTNRIEREEAMLYPLYLPPDDIELHRPIKKY